MRLPRLAITNQAFRDVAGVREFCLRHDCAAVEYTFRRAAASRPEVEAELSGIEALLASGLMLRYHLAFPGFDLGHPDPVRAAEARRFQTFCLKTVAGLGGDRVTVHVGLDPDLRGRVDYDAARQGLAELAEAGHGAGVRVCLENLRLGKTGDPRLFQTLLDQGGVFATLDVGHASARELVAGEAGYALDFIARCGDRLLGAHVYEIEAAPWPGEPARHLPPRELSAIRPLLDAMVRESACDWWLIELMDASDLARTLGLLRDYLDGMAVAAPPVAPFAARHPNREDVP